MVERVGVVASAPLGLGVLEPELVLGLLDSDLGLGVRDFERENKPAGDHLDLERLVTVFGVVKVLLKSSIDSLVLSKTSVENFESSCD